MTWKQKCVFVDVKDFVDVHDKHHDTFVPPREKKRMVTRNTSSSIGLYLEGATGIIKSRQLSKGLLKVGYSRNLRGFREGRYHVLTAPQGRLNSVSSVTNPDSQHLSSHSQNTRLPDFYRPCPKCSERILVTTTHPHAGLFERPPFLNP